MAAGETPRTHDHETIRRWAERRNGRPARVKGTGKLVERDGGH